jgi:hypothetical protein
MAVTGVECPLMVIGDVQWGRVPAAMDRMKVDRMKVTYSMTAIDDV